ncbi:MAG: ATP-dependent Clp protease adapter ClpS [Magnetovibrionaceae bacterium]
MTGGPVLTGDDRDHFHDDDGGQNTGIAVKPRAKTKKPSMYKVLMLNDDYTPMEFVVHVLEQYFAKNHEEATKIMLHVHQRGVGVCGVFTYEVAETKVTQVMDLARQHQHPLQCTIEKDGDGD